MTNQVIKGAGFIIYRRNKDGIIEFLGLEAFDKMAKRDGGNGIYRKVVLILVKIR